MEKLSNKVESLAVNSQHIINSPLPVKQLDFFHEDDIKVSCSKFEAKGSCEACSAQADHVTLKDSGLLGKENLIDPVDVMKKSASNLHTDSAAMTMRCQGVFKSTIEGNVHPTQEDARDSHLISRDLNQPTHNKNKSLAAYSNNCKTWVDSKSKFASEEVEARTPSSSIPLKDQSKLSSWLPPELCAMYMKKGISELYPWQVRILFPNYLFNKSLAASFLSPDHFCLCWKVSPAKCCKLLPPSLLVGLPLPIIFAHKLSFFSICIVISTSPKQVLSKLVCQLV